MGEALRGRSQISILQNCDQQAKSKERNTDIFVFRIEKTGGEYGLVPTHKNILRETLEYTWPFFILDTFHVKHYAGVPDDVINVKRLNWIQVAAQFMNISYELRLVVDRVESACIIENRKFATILIAQ